MVQYGFIICTASGNYRRLSSKSTKSDHLLAGEPFASAESEACPADNPTVFDLVAFNVHVLGLTGSVPMLICNRATGLEGFEGK
jgi:hypothetical protein